MGYAAMKMINVILLCVLLAGCAKIHAQDSGGATVVPWLHVYGATVGQCYKATETTVLAPVPCWQPHAQEKQKPAPTVVTVMCWPEAQGSSTTLDNAQRL